VRQARDGRKLVILNDPLLLDFLTVFFIVAGCFLLWLNLRPQRRDVVITPIKNPPSAAPRRDVLMPSLSLPFDPQDDRKPRLTQEQADHLAGLIHEVLSSQKIAVNRHWQSRRRPAVHGSAMPACRSQEMLP